MYNLPHEVFSVRNLAERGIIFKVYYFTFKRIKKEILWAFKHTCVEHISTKLRNGINVVKFFSLHVLSFTII